MSRETPQSRDITRTRERRRAKFDYNVQQMKERKVGENDEFESRISYLEYLMTNNNNNNTTFV